MSACERRGSLSDDWTEHALGDIAHIQQGKTLAKKDMEGGSHPVFGANGIIGWHSEGHYGREVIALGCRGSCGTLDIAPASAWLGNNVMAVWEKSPEETDFRYLRYALETVDLERSGAISGGVQRQITRTSLAPVRIPLPPLKVQQRIADFISSIEASAAALTHRIEAALRLKTQYLGRTLAGLEGGQSRTLGSLADVHSGVSWKKEDELSPGDPAGIGVMGVSNVQRDYIHIHGCTWIPSTDQARQRLIEPHTILTIRTNGNADRIGNVHIVPEDAVGYTISSFLTAITPHDPDTSEFVLRVLQSPQVQRAITSATSGSTGLKNIAVTWLRRLEIPWPAERIRNEVTAVASALDTLIHALEEERDALARLREAALERLISSREQIPVSYDRFLADENPDSVNLEPATV